MEAPETKPTAVDNGCNVVFGRATNIARFFLVMRNIFCLLPYGWPYRTPSYCLNLFDMVVPMRPWDGDQMKTADALSTRQNRLARMLSGSAVLALAATVAMAQDQRGNSSVTSGQGDIVVSTARTWGGNHDGAYTCDEWKQYLSRMYNLADSRHVGFITAADFARVKRASAVFANADFDYFDTSGKGRISRKDFIAQPSPFFTRFDPKASCRVTEADIQKVLAAEKQTKTPEGGRGGGRRGGGGGMGRGGMGGSALGGGGVNF